eukprot:scaffold2363_cov69-Attheya_sp.AAC.1
MVMRSAMMVRSAGSNRKSDGTVGVASSPTPVALTIENEGIMSPDARLDCRFYCNQLGNIKTAKLQHRQLRSSFRYRKVLQLPITCPFVLVISTFRVCNHN